MKTLKNACSIHWVTTIPPSATRERKLKFLLQSINVPWVRDRKKPVSKQETSGTLRLNVCSWYDCFAKEHFRQARPYTQIVIWSAPNSRIPICHANVGRRACVGFMLSYWLLARRRFGVRVAVELKAVRSAAAQGCCLAQCLVGIRGLARCGSPGEWIVYGVLGAGSASKRKGRRRSGPSASWSPGSVGPNGIR